MFFVSMTNFSLGARPGSPFRSHKDRTVNPIENTHFYDENGWGFSSLLSGLLSGVLVRCGDLGVCININCENTNDIRDGTNKSDVPDNQQTRQRNNANCGVLCWVVFSN